MIVHDGTYTKLKVLKQTFAEVSEGQIVLPDNEPFYANELTLINSSQQWVESGITDTSNLLKVIFFVRPILNEEIHYLPSLSYGLKKRSYLILVGDAILSIFVRLI